MSLKFNLPWILTILIVSACASDDDSEASSDDDDQEPSGETTDASAKDGGGRDARADGSMSEHDGDAKVPPNEDAGRDAMSEHDAGPAGGEPDAGHDAGQIDAGHDAGAGDAGAGDAGAMSTCDTLTYASFGQTFLTTYCVSCHGPTIAQKNIHLDSLAGVTAAKAKVKSEVSSGGMPPRGSKAPTSGERMQLGQWIDCGPK